MKSHWARQVQEESTKVVERIPEVYGGKDVWKRYALSESDRVTNGTSDASAHDDELMWNGESVKNSD